MLTSCPDSITCIASSDEDKMEEVHLRMPQLRSQCGFRGNVLDPLLDSFIPSSALNDALTELGLERLICTQRPTRTERKRSSTAIKGLFLVMFRCSPRLQSFSDLHDRNRFSYKETPVKIFKRRKGLKKNYEASDQDPSLTSSDAICAQDSTVLVTVPMSGFPFGAKKTLLPLLLFGILLCGTCLVFPVLVQISVMTANKPADTLKEKTGYVDPYSALKDTVNNMLVGVEHRQREMVSEVEQRLMDDLKVINKRMESLNMKHHLHMAHELAALKADVRSTATLFERKVKALEDHTAEMQHVLDSIKMTPPPLYPVAPDSTESQLNPELKRALDKLSTDIMAEKISATGKTDCKTPMANMMPDFALKSQGAYVVRASETYHHSSLCLSVSGIWLLCSSVTPERAIEGNSVMMPGKCWPIKGDRGSLVVALSHPVQVSHVTIDHLPHYNNPYGYSYSAPRDFKVYGMSTADEDGTLLGSFTFEAEGEPTQTFEIFNPSGAVCHYVELRILSNWGQPEYTCLYRLRVHGQIPSVG